MHIACWVSRIMNTHSEYVILIAFLWQQWLYQGISMLRLCIHCLSLLHSSMQFGDNLISPHSFLVLDLSASLPPRKGPTVPMESEGGWAPELAWTPWRISWELNYDIPVIVLIVICCHGLFKPQHSSDCSVEKKRNLIDIYAVTGNKSMKKNMKWWHRGRGKRVNGYLKYSFWNVSV